MSRGLRAWLVSLGGGLGALGVPMTAQARHPAPGPDVPWLLVSLVGLVLLFAAAWGLTAFFERREQQRSQGPESRENSR